MGVVHKLIRSLTHIVSPRTCKVCGCTLTSSEDVLCLGCLMEVPRTYVHHDDFNEIHRRLGHHIMVDRAAGWFYYQKDTPYARLLIDAKYSGMPKIDYHLGKVCAKELQIDGFFSGIDVMVPMPMHWSKRLKRGYNQAEEICRGISAVTDIPWRPAIKAQRGHGVLSRLGKVERQQKIKGTHILTDANAVKGRHVLLVDDIITTGASCTEAIRALSAGAPASISVLALGLTKAMQ